MAVTVAGPWCISFNTHSNPMVRRHDPYFTHEEGESQRASAGKGKPKLEPRSLTVEHTRSTEQGANVDLFNG